VSLPDVTSREQWLVARRELLVREKELTRQRDALNADRRRLPIAEIDKDYVFEGPDGTIGLADPVRRAQPADRSAHHVRPVLAGPVPRLLGRRGNDVAGCAPAS
jgi:hypothetical protein